MTKITKLFIHDEYDPRTFANDIALLKIPKLNSFNRQQQAICLPRELKMQSLINVSKSLLALGWGGTQHVQQGRIVSKANLSKKLKQVKIPFIKNRECLQNVQKKLKSGLRNWHFNSSTQFCAADKTGRSDKCHGDSGGPAMVLTNDKTGRLSWLLVGIVSWGYGCAQKGEYSYYTKVSAFLDWIEKKMTG